MKKYLPLIIAGIILCASAVMFFTASPPQDTASGTSAPVSLPSAQKPAPSPGGFMPIPHVTKVKKPLDCIIVTGDRYNGVEVAQFNNVPREGIAVVNNCMQNIVVIDLKAGTLNTNFLSSILPVRSVLTDQRAPASRERDHYIAFARSGKRCDEKEHAGEKACRFIPVPPAHGIFLSTPVKNWFEVKLKDGGIITGYLLAPMKPGEVHKKEVPKMPDKGFKFTRGPN